MSAAPERRGGVDRRRTHRRAARLRLPWRYRLYRARPMLAYALVVVVALVGFWKFEQADRRSMDDRRRLCEAAMENRDALRQTYQDVAALGRSLVVADGQANDQAADEGQLAALDQFERERLTALPRITSCPP